MLKTKVIGFVSILFFSVLLLSCSSREARLVAPPPNFPISKIVETDDGFTIFSYTASPNNVSKGRQDFYKSIKEFSIIVFADEDSIATIPMKIEIMGEYYKNSDANVVFYAKGVSEGISIDADELFYEFRIKTDEKDYVYIQNYEQLRVKEEEPKLEAYSIIDNIEEDKCSFGMVAIRLKAIDEEWIPNSEHCRALMNDGKGRKLWSSSYNQNFMQMVYPVYPEEIGDYHNYILDWGGQKNNGSDVKQGYYQVHLTINSRPERYGATINLNWKQND
jgi:hypothetical protein